MLNRDLNELDKNFRKKVEKFLELCPYIFITEGYRTQERQNELYKQGRSKKGNKITWTLDSLHTQRIAIDIAFFYGDELYPEDFKKWEKVGKIAKECGIDWGYDLWGRDKPHFQDNGAKFEEPDEEYKQGFPNWAKPYVEEMKKKGIKTSPNELVGDIPLYQLVGIILKLNK